MTDALDELTSLPDSKRTTVFAETPANLASSATFIFKAARAIRHCVPVIILVSYRKIGVDATEIAC